MRSTLLLIVLNMGVIQNLAASGMVMLVKEKQDEIPSLRTLAALALLGKNSNLYLKEAPKIGLSYQKLAQEATDKTLPIWYTLPLKVLIPLTYELLFHNTTCSVVSKSALIEQVLFVKGNLTKGRTDIDPKNKAFLSFLWTLNGVSTLLSRGLFPLMRDLSGPSPTLLHEVLITPKLAYKKELVQLLLDHNAPVNGRDIFGRTPLHYAVICELTGCAALLLNRGADPALTDDAPKEPLDKISKTALHYAKTLGGRTDRKILDTDEVALENFWAGETVQRSVKEYARTLKSKRILRLLSIKKGQR